MPLAAATRTAGRIGIHMGARLQLLLGSTASVSWNRNGTLAGINESWVRPAQEEIAKTAIRVESGYYW
jgi:hypothetical protein